MARLEGKCPGDCTKCRLLEEGQVDMQMCMMDQIFQRTQRNERILNEILERINKGPVPKGIALVREPETVILENEEAGQ